MQIFLEAPDFSESTMSEIEESLKDVFSIEFNEAEIDSIGKSNNAVDDIWKLTINKCKNSLCDYMTDESCIGISYSELLEMLKSHILISTLYTIEEQDVIDKKFCEMEKSVFEKYYPPEGKAEQVYGHSETNYNKTKQLKKQCNQIWDECAHYINDTNPLSCAIASSTSIKLPDNKRKSKKSLNKDDKTSVPIYNYTFKSGHEEVLYTLLSAWKYCPYSYEMLNVNNYDYMAKFLNKFTTIVHKEDCKKTHPYNQTPYYLFDRLFNISLFHTIAHHLDGLNKKNTEITELIVIADVLCKTVSLPNVCSRDIIVDKMMDAYYYIKGRVQKEHKKRRKMIQSELIDQDIVIRQTKLAIHDESSKQEEKDLILDWQKKMDNAVFVLSECIFPCYERCFIYLLWRYAKQKKAAIESAYTKGTKESEKVKISIPELMQIDLQHYYDRTPKKADYNIERRLTEKSTLKFYLLNDFRLLKYIKLKLYSMNEYYDPFYSVVTENIYEFIQSKNEEIKRNELFEFVNSRRHDILDNFYKLINQPIQKTDLLGLHFIKAE